MENGRTISFRFDIDTHKCIKEGVPNLLSLSEKEKIYFTFYLNVGKSISFYESVSSVLNKNTGLLVEQNEKIDMMSALKKLGLKDYIFAALINPSLFKYKRNIIELYNSDSEMGIHGGKNHALWQKYASQWDENKINKEIRFSLNQIRKICPNYQPNGFASPGWNSPELLPKILERNGFKYFADMRCNEKKEIIDYRKGIPCIGVNLLGEPGGVAFFESCRARGYDDEKILDIVKKTIGQNQHTIIYDHPYYAGIHELKIISDIISYCKVEHIKVVKVGKLI